MKFVIVLISLVVATQSAPPARCQPSRNGGVTINPDCSVSAGINVEGGSLTKNPNGLNLETNYRESVALHRSTTGVNHLQTNGKTGVNANIQLPVLKNAEALAAKYKRPLPPPGRF